MKLHTFPPAFGLRNLSPFCLKVEMALTHLGMEFELVEQHDPRKAPKGKMPFLEVDDELIPDSDLIFEYLDELTQGRLFGNLSPEEHATGTAFTRLAEDHLYWLMVASRWLDDAWFPNVRQGFFAAFPPVARTLIGIIARRQVRSTLHLHGLGRHSLEEQKGFARRDLQAISDQVSARQFIAADHLSAHDFAVAGLLAGILDQQPRTWVNVIVDEFPALRDYAERVQQAVGVYGRYI